MQSVEVGAGVTMAYSDDCFAEPWSTPEAVVMVHGNAESSRAWTCWVPHLARHFRVLRPDMPGFGRSPEPAEYGWMVHELARDLRGFVDRLGLDRFHLVGAKYGGSTCMRFAIDNPGRLISLNLFGSPVRGSGSGNADLIREFGVREWAAKTQAARLGSSASAAQIAWWTDGLMGRTGARAAFSASASRIDMELEDQLGRIDAPTLIVTTAESGLQTVEAVNRYASQIPVSEVVIMPGDSYHIAAVEPDICAQHALRFMQAASRRHKPKT